MTISNNFLVSSIIINKKNRIMKLNFLSKIQNVRSEIDLVVDVGVTSWFIFNTLLIVIVEIFQCSDRHRKENPERYMYVVILILIGLVICSYSVRIWREKNTG